MQSVVKRRAYQASYRNELETPVEEPETTDPSLNTSELDPISPEEQTWRKRYGDLRSHSQTQVTSLTDKVKSLEGQLLAAQKKEIQIPSTQEEIAGFAQRYPDVFRHIRSIAMSEILSQKKDLEHETTAVKENLEKLTREAAEKKIYNAHKDFDDINNSEEFHLWASQQSPAIQKMLFDSSDPDDCIAALDLYKAQLKKPVGRPRKPETGADTLVRTKGTIETPQEANTRIWKASDIGKLTPRQYERVEAEIEQARAEGRIDMNA